MNRRSKITPQSTEDKTNKTIPGQALTPAMLLKRHLAGTLPPIDLTKRYEYHYDENGNQIAEPLPTEMHEVHALSVAIRQRQYEEALEQRRKQAEKHKEAIISEYRKLQGDLGQLIKTADKSGSVKISTDSNPDPRFTKTKKPSTPKP